MNRALENTVRYVAYSSSKIIQPPVKGMDCMDWFDYSGREREDTSLGDAPGLECSKKVSV